LPEAERTAIVAATRYQEQRLSVRDIAESLRISKVTLYKYLRLEAWPYTPAARKRKSRDPAEKLNERSGRMLTL